MAWSRRPSEARGFDAHPVEAATVKNRMSKLNRSALLGSAAIVGGLLMMAACSVATAASAVRASTVRVLPAQATWPQPPAQVAVTEDVAALPGGARLWYWDTGGSGEPIVLLHAYTGSAASWEYQQPVLAKAGYRVIGYSRRGHYKSEPVDASNPGTASGDLHELIEHLGIGRFHLVATAAGGFIAFDYAVSHQDRLLSLVVANSLGGIQDEEYGKILKALLPPSFSQLPPDFRELGPSYRAGNRPGVERWLELHELAGGGGKPQPSVNKVTFETLAALRVPTLMLTGDADLYMPPSNLRSFVGHIPNSEGLIIGEVAHSAYWEQPEIFNQELIRFLKKHRRK
jgi:pimeloyl-ACP methyl ester carboxylesterase